jgi:hypothetical protein
VLKSVFISLIRFYKKILSPIFVAFFGFGCRFTPTCSDYTIEAIEKKGVVLGVWYGIKRFARCNPFSKPRHDPVV